MPMVRTTSKKLIVNVDSKFWNKLELNIILSECSKTHIHTYTRTHVHTYTHTHIHTHTYTHIHTHTHIHTC